MAPLGQRSMKNFQFQRNSKTDLVMLKATNIVLQGLPPDMYAIVNHHKVAKEIWDRVKLLMQGTKLSLQEKECKLNDEFDKFSCVKGETLYQYYWRFAQLINNMNVDNMSMRPFQVNTKFLNNLLPEWSKFITDVKLAKDLYTTNFDLLYSYLEQHEAHANETRLRRLAVPMFSQGDDPIAGLNKAMAFLSPVAASRGQARVVKCYNCQGEGHMARQCTQPKRTRNAAWFKEKAILVEAHAFSQILDEEQLAFLADLGILDGQAARTTILNTAAFQTEDLDVYDSDCDDVSNAKAILMTNLSNYGLDVISEVPHSESYHHDLDNESVHAM
ncbi:ubiquitin carboxyl-terminal hydrolase 12-like protein [Tanacetum coccineum]